MAPRPQPANPAPQRESVTPRPMPATPRPRPEPQAPAPVHPALVDLVFLLDCTQSMARSMPGARESCLELADRLAKSRVDAQFTVVGFGDAELKEPITALGPTSDAEVLRTNLARLPQLAGGDMPESCVDALETALAARLRSQSLPIFILVTDGTSHRAEELGEVAQALRERGAWTLVHAHALDRAHFRTLWEPAGAFFPLDEPGTEPAAATAGANGFSALTAAVLARVAPASAPPPAAAAPDPPRGSSSAKSSAPPADSGSEFTVTLSWGAAPADLDAHLEGPLPRDEAFHVYFKHLSESSGESRAALDLDDRDGDGPEVVTVRGLRPGRYHYFVHDYSNCDRLDSTALGKSAATVELRIGSDRSTFRAKRGTAGNLWHVFDVEVNPQGTFVRPINQFESRKFRKLQGRSASIVLLIDVSGSMAGLIEPTKQACYEFIKLVPLGRGGRVGLATFGSVTGPLHPITTDPAALRMKIAPLRAGGDTPLTEGLEAARKLVDAAPGNRMIVVFTDGQPTNRTSALAVADALKKSRVDIWAIGTQGADMEFLKTLVSQPDQALFAAPENLRSVFAGSGGKVYAPDDGTADGGAFPDLNAAVLDFARHSLGQQVGRGAAWNLAAEALAAAGADASKRYAPGRPLQADEKPLPGDIVLFRSCKFSDDAAASTIEVGRPDHVAIVAKVDRDQWTVLHQNFQGKKSVHEWTMDVAKKVEGRIVVFRPRPAPVQPTPSKTRRR